MCVLLVKWAQGAPVLLQGTAFHLHYVSVIQLVTLWTAAWPQAGRSGFLNWSYYLVIITPLFVSHETLGLCPSATQVSRTLYAFLFHTLAVVLRYTPHQWTKGKGWQLHMLKHHLQHEVIGGCWTDLAAHSMRSPRKVNSNQFFSG